MIAALGAVGPIFALILIGWALRRAPWLPEPFWLGAERVVYWVLFPALLTTSLGAIDWAKLPVPGIAVAVVGSLLAMTVLSLAVSMALRFPPPQLTSVVQGCLRPNIYIGFAAAAALWGATGLSLFSLVVAIGIPLVNLIAVILLSRHGSGAPSWAQTFRQIILNPIILGGLAGIALSLSPVRLPMPFADTLKLLGQASLPVALLSVGAGLDFSMLREAKLPLGVASFGKLLVLPAITFGFCRALGLDPVATAICTLFNALPPSPSSYVMARAMGGDHRLMAAILTLQTVISILSLPLILMYQS